MNPIEHATIAGCDLELQRISSSREDTPTLVFLHEGLGSLALWRDVPSELCARTGCAGLVYSRYGNGFSEVLHERRTAGYMHDEAQTTLPALLAHLGLRPRDAILVGHSDGASIAIIYAGKVATPRGLVLEAPHLFVEAESLAAIRASKEAYQRGNLRARLRKHHTDVDATFFGWNDIWLAPEFADWNIEASVTQIQAPILAVQGADDAYGTFAQLDALAARRRGPCDRLLLAECEHTPHRERRDATLDAMAAFVERLG